MTVGNIAQQAVDGFAITYYNFRNFQQDAEYRPYWNKCVECVKDRDLLINIIFCNDVYSIPPVKTFLTVYCDDFIRLTDDDNARLNTYLKRSIGAFWGMIFKFVLGYKEQKSVSVTMNEYFGIRTASVYAGKPKNLTIV